MEALNNVVRHAEARSALVEVEMAPDRVRPTIADDGNGFHLEEHLQHSLGLGKLGLVAMRERAEIINGTLELRSSPGQGTRIIVQLAG